MPFGRKSHLALLLIAMLPPGPAAAFTSRPSADSNVIPGHYIVVYDSSAESVRTETNARERKLGFDSELRYRHALKGFAGVLSPGQVRALRRDPEVAYLAPDRRVQASSLVPLAPGDAVPTGPRRIAAATTSTVEHAAGVAVAVLDTGVDLEHPDLNVAHGINCVTPGGSSDDDSGHGTHVAGTIAAENDGAGVTGVAPGTQLWAVKVLDASGSGSSSSIACGLDWVTANAGAKNIKVLNMSFGAPGDPVEACGVTDDPVHQAVCRLTAADVLSVAAAGNNGWDFDFAGQPDLPAAYPEVLTATAMSDSDGRVGGVGGAPSCDPGEGDDVAASFSNFAGTAAGAAHTIAAPGVCILSTWPTNFGDGPYFTASGTSMAAPHVAGIAALCESHAGHGGTCAGKTPAEVIATMRSAAQSFTGANPAYGFRFDPSHDPIENVYFGYLTGAFDTDDPETVIASGPAAATRFTDASIEFSSDELGSRFQCSLDAGEWVACGSPHRLSMLADGSHTLVVRAIDAAGNFDATPAVRTWTVDATEPATSIVSGPARRTTRRSARFKFAASEATSRFRCKLDGRRWSACSSPKRLTRLDAGSHKLSVAAVDAVGNLDPTPAKRRWIVLPPLDKIESRLDADLVSVAKALRRLGIAGLVRRGRFNAKGLRAVDAGKLQVVLTGRPAGVAGVARKVALAKGSRRVSRAGRYALKLKLTRPGKRLLRGDDLAKVTLRVKFRDALRRVATADRSLKLAR